MSFSYLEDQVASYIYYKICRSVENKGEITTEYQVEAEETQVEKEDEILVECKVETSNIVSLLMLDLK